MNNNNNTINDDNNNNKKSKLKRTKAKSKRSAGFEKIKDDHTHEQYMSGKFEDCFKWKNVSCHFLYYLFISIF